MADLTKVWVLTADPEDYDDTIETLGIYSSEEKAKIAKKEAKAKMDKSIKEYKWRYGYEYEITEWEVE